MKVGIVSTFPIKGSTHVREGGVQGYVKKLTSALSKSLSITVLCEKIKGCESHYFDTCVKVVRCWNKGLSFPFQIWYTSLRLKIDIYHVQHEYFLYGNTISALIFPFLIFLLRIRAPVITTLHGVLSEKYANMLLDPGDTQLSNSLKFAVLRVNLKFISYFSNRIVVHENFLRDLLIREYKIKNHKISVIPHGIDIHQGLDNTTAKIKLGIKNKKVILFFGYLTKRKGLELLLDAYRNLSVDKNTLLIIGAGENPRLKKSLEYSMYYNKLKQIIESNSNIIFPGFIEENLLGLYLSAADIVVFPYLIPVASSGPLHLALSFDKLILCSDIPIFKDMIKTDRLLFKSNDSEDLQKKLKSLLQLSQIEKDELNRKIASIKHSCSWEFVSLKTLNLYKEILLKKN
jgi:glycosyltransferase involved in cell wall biosynthesis